MVVEKRGREMFCVPWPVLRSLPKKYPSPRSGSTAPASLQKAPHPRCFFAKSAESIEKKRVEFLMSAKMCKRVRKSVKRKAIDCGRIGMLAGSMVGSLGVAPHENGRSSNERTCARGIAQAVEKKGRCATGTGAFLAGKGGSVPCPPGFRKIFTRYRLGGGG